jgi:hypothetical protein
MRTTFLPAAVAVLASAWFGPLPDHARQSFAAHMSMRIASASSGAAIATADEASS